MFKPCAGGGLEPPTENSFKKPSPCRLRRSQGAPLANRSLFLLSFRHGSANEFAAGGGFEPPETTTLTHKRTITNRMRAPTLLPAVPSLPTVLSQNVSPAYYAGSHTLVHTSYCQMQPTGDGAPCSVLEPPYGILDPSQCAATHIACANHKIVFHGLLIFIVLLFYTATPNCNSADRLRKNGVCLAAQRFAYRLTGNAEQAGDTTYFAVFYKYF